MKMVLYRTLGLLTASAALLTAACSATASSPSSRGAVSCGDKAIGALKTSGFNRRNGVGQSRVDFAKKALPDATVRAW